MIGMGRKAVGLGPLVLKRPLWGSQKYRFSAIFEKWCRLRDSNT
jgi:hypothetical protein